jgi:hypothetical protein
MADLDLDGLLVEARAHTQAQQPGLDALLAQARRVRPQAQQRRRSLLTISNGLGRDSATIIALLVQGKLEVDGQRVRPQDVDLVVFSDPGSEWGFSTNTAMSGATPGGHPTAQEALGQLLDLVGVPHVTLEKPHASVWLPWLEGKRDLATQLMNERDAGRTDWGVRVVRYAKGDDKGDDKWKAYQLGSKGAKSSWFPGERAAVQAMNERQRQQYETGLIRLDPMDFQAYFTRAMYGWSARNPQPWLQTDWRARAAQTGRPTWRQKAEGGGYHPRPPIMAQREAMGWGTIMKGHACTIGHKIDPIDNLLNDLTIATWGVPTSRPKKHKALDSWNKRVSEGQAEPHRIMIGFAAGEEKRIERGRLLQGKAPWRRAVYPLAEMGIRKEDQGAILRNIRVGGRRFNLDWIKKSGCFLCHYQPEGWFWALRETRPDVFKALVAYERRGNHKNPNWSIKNVRRVTTKRDALPLLAQAGIRAPGQKRFSAERALPGLRKWLNKAGALELLAQVRPEAVEPVLIGELVDQWREANPRATVEQVLAKTYERCGGFNVCADHGHMLGSAARRHRPPTRAQRVQLDAYRWGHITWDQLVSRVGLSRARYLTGQGG